jgi:hypothetical protein
MKLFKKHTPYKYGKHSKYNKYTVTPMKNYAKCTNIQTGTSVILSINDLKSMIKHNKNILVFGKSGIGRCTTVQEYIKEVK